MTDTDPLLSIGAFSRLTRLSLKALRLYDESGLLIPARSDPASGYRFYHPVQAARAEHIALLPRLELSLSDIRALLALSPEGAAMRVRHHWARRERVYRARRELMASVEQRLKGNDMPEYPVHERQLPARPVAALRRRVVVPNAQDFIEEACRTLEATIGGQGRARGAEFAVLYHGQVDHENDGPVEVVMPFEGGALATTGEVYLREEPAHRELYTTIGLAQTRLPEILGAYDAVAAQVQVRGLTCPASPREVYFADKAASGPDDPFCHIAFPVTEPSHA